MKYPFLYFIISILIPKLSLGQFNYTVSHKSNSRDILISDTKRFIESFWGYNKVKPEDYQKEEISFNTMVKLPLKDVDFFYTYNVKWIISDNQTQMMVDNVKYSHTSSDKYNHCNLTPTTNYSEEFTCLSNDKFSDLMKQLQDELHGITWAYENHMKKTKYNFTGQKISFTQTNTPINKINYAGLLLNQSTNDKLTSNTLSIIGLSSIFGGSLLYTNNPNMGKVLFTVGGVCNISSLIYNYKSLYKQKKASVSLKNY